MRREALDRFRTPTGALFELAAVTAEERGEIEEGQLAGGGRRVPIRNFIPRFTEGPLWVASFGDQWNRYRRTQLDRFSGIPWSRDRFFNGTGWRAHELEGSLVLEVGCGAGRFTEILLEAGADVTAVDLSLAVDACWENHGPHPRLTIVQADLFDLPLAQASFDYVFCYGVLQHTPDVRRAFQSLLPYLRPGGRIAVDVYLRWPWITRWTAKYWYRALTKRMSRERLWRLVEWYVPRWIPLDNWFSRRPILRSIVPAVVPCWNYTGIARLSPELITQWAVLDTFDALASWYDKPQTVRGMRAMFEMAGLVDIDVRAGGNGILGNGRKP